MAVWAPSLLSTYQMIRMMLGFSSRVPGKAYINASSNITGGIETCPLLSLVVR